MVRRHLAHPDVYSRNDIHKERHFFDRYAVRQFGPAERSLYHDWFPRPSGSLTGEFSLRIGPAVKHVIAEKIGAGSDVRHVYRGDIGRLHERATMIGKFHAAAGFRHKIWIVRERFIFLSGEAGQVCRFLVDVALEGEEKSLVGRRFAWEVLPKTIGIGAEDRDDFLRREIRAGPTSDSK